MTVGRATAEQSAGTAVVDRTFSAALVSESVLEEPVRSLHQRARALTTVTLAFWGTSFGVATLANVFGDVPNLALMLAARSGLYMFGLALCFLLYRVQEAAGRSVFSRIRALALVAPLAAGVCAWGSLAIAQYVGAEIATPAEITKTVARWLWFFVGWSAASLTIEYYFTAREFATASGSRVSAGHTHPEESVADRRPTALEVTPSLKLWIGLETTADISRACTAVALDFNEAFNAEMRARPWRSSLANFDVLLVIMNPEIAPPLAEGAILQRHLNRFECRVRVDFLTWTGGSRSARIGLIKRAIAIGLDQVAPDVIGPIERERFRDALESAVAVASSE
jgi:hypothetical protein